MRKIRLNALNWARSRHWLVRRRMIQNWAYADLVILPPGDTRTSAYLAGCRAGVDRAAMQQLPKAVLADLRTASGRLAMFCREVEL